MKPKALALICIKIQFSFHSVKIIHKWHSIRIAFTGTAGKEKGHNLKKLVVALCLSFSSPGQLYMILSQIKTSAILILLYKQHDTSCNKSKVHNMPATVASLILREEVCYSIEM